MGKGGTRKTTSAVATALHFASQWPARKVLLVSTDPAHSLSDSFDCPVGSTVPSVAGGGDNLFATQSGNQAGLGDLLGQDLQFVLFGGKGGVRKTTIAAATAIELAQRDHLYVLSQ